jgi:hypothetical protein
MACGAGLESRFLPLRTQPLTGYQVFSERNFLTNHEFEETTKNSQKLR